MRKMRLGAVVVALSVAAACGDSAPPASNEAPKAAPAEAAPEAKAEEGMQDMDPAELEAEADTKASLVPSPIETQAALKAAGVQTELASMLEDRKFAMDKQDTDRVAMRTGVVLADMLLTVKTSSDEQLLGQIASIRAGMATLKGGPDIAATLDDLRDRVKAGAIDRDELLTEVDELSNVVIPELEFNGVGHIVPFIQAGSWVNGAHLVGKAVAAKGTPAAGDKILKVPDVVDYFSTFAKAQAGGADGNVAAALTGTLDKLKAVSTKEASLTKEDIDTVVNSTGVVLALL